MKQSLRHIRDAVVMGLAWAVVWAPAAVLIGTMIVDPDNSMDEMWVLVGAYPGFLSGAVFSALLALKENSRRLGEVQMPRCAAWGALSGLVVGVIPLTLGKPTGEIPAWLLFSAMIGSVTLMGALSGVASALLARMAKTRELRAG
jgi:ABC-type Co2+ transport system permease subunit